MLNYDKKYTIDDLLRIMEILRSENGCPWDRVQTHDSIKKDMIEEAYEAIDALDNLGDDMFANELGDLLLQVVFHSQIAKERGAFDFDTVVGEICNKLITRHTHVFGDDKANDEASALDTWEKNKKKEKNIKSDTDALSDVARYLPALMRAEKVQKKAQVLNICDVCEDVQSKLLETIKNINTQNISEEDFENLLFYTVALGRKYGFSAETSMSDATDKFINRCRKNH